MTEKAEGPGRLDRVVVDRHLIEELHGAGLVSDAARDHALALMEPPGHWGLWISRLFAGLGVALILAGVVYFFAFNWAHIPPLAKLGGIGAVLAGLCAAVLWLGMERAAGRLAVTSAIVMVGVFLAVFGQVYQTGADAWTLFAGWATLTSVWVVVSTSAASWAVWLVVVNTALVLYWQQAMPRDALLHDGLYGVLIVVDGAFLMLREVFVGRRTRWLDGWWTRLPLVLTVLGAAVIAVCTLVFEPSKSSQIVWASGGVGFAAIGGAFAVYRRRLPDVGVIAAAVVACAIIAVAMVFKASFEIAGRHEEIGLFLVSGIASLAIFAVAVSWLRRVGREMGAGR